MSNVASLCRRELVTIDQGATLVEAARAMRRHHVGALVVTAEADGGAQVVGVVTDRDLALEVLARDLAPAELRIGVLASRQLVAVPGEVDVAAAVAKMREAGVRRLLVADGASGAVHGLVSHEDLLEALAADLAGLAQALRAEVAREAADRAPIEPPPPPRPVFLRAGTPGMPWPSP